MEVKKEKIRVSVIREEVKEIEMEISFPYYTKNEGLYCKFLSKDEAVWVCDYGFARSVKWSNGAVPDGWIANKPITEEEFNEKFKEVMTTLKEKNNEKTI